MIAVVEDISLHGPGGDVGALHGQGDAVGGYEDQDDEVEPALGGEVLAPHAEPVSRGPHVEGVGLPLRRELRPLLHHRLLLKQKLS